MNELFSQGLHHGAAAVEIGDPTMVSENSLKWVNGLEYESEKALVEFTAYANQIKNYIYLSPTGETFVSLRGTFNVYEYLQADAFFYGFDLSGSYTFSDRLNGYLKGSIIRAKNTDEGIISLLFLRTEWIGDFLMHWAGNQIQTPIESQ